MQKSDRPLEYMLMCSDSSPALINQTYISRQSNEQALRQTEIFKKCLTGVEYCRIIFFVNDTIVYDL